MGRDYRQKSPKLQLTVHWGMENEPEFICGVIEGFYGRPWTLDQRVDLYRKLESFNLNCYVYAPKDDLKHRLSWRELYTTEEAESLRHLISEAKAHNQIFVYALSPGNDIRYSDENDIDAVRKKLEQVQSLGCTSFALLFDDIPKEMHPADQRRYESFASAQVQITNRTYEAMQRPTFLFCPTEYCETRAIPTLNESEYLDTIGRFLHQHIYIMWTGPKVVSRWITTAHCERVEKVLRRKPLIWDNFFANDYDIRRLFLGPLEGRPLPMRRAISGILLNPNNKHEANHIPMASLSQWRQASESLGLNASSFTYSPEEAFLKALSSWEQLFNTETPEVPTIKAQTIPEIQEAIGESETKNGCSVTPSTSDPGSGRSESLAMESDSFVPPDVSSEVPLPVMAIDEMVHAVLTSPNTQENEPDLNAAVNSLVPEYNTCTVMGTPIGPCSHKNSAEEMQLEGNTELKTKPLQKPPIVTGLNNHSKIEENELRRFVDLFYLPFQYGKQGEELLDNLHFLLANAHKEDDRYSPTDSGFHEAIEYVCQFINDFNVLYWKIMNCSNKLLLSEMLPYIWETHGMLSVAEGVAEWLASGNLQKKLRVSPTSWKNMSYDDEPWTSTCPVRGFSLDLAHLLGNTDGVLDLLRNRNPLPMSVRTFHIRSITTDDMDNLHYIFGPNPPGLPKNEELFDRYFGPYIFSSEEPQFAFISYEEWKEDSTHLKYPHCAVTGIRDVNFYLETLWLEYQEMMRSKYFATRDLRSGTDQKAVRREIDSWKPPAVSAEVLSKYPSRINLHSKCGTDDAIASKRIIQTLATVLSYSGSTGVHILCHPDDYNQISFLAKLNFELIPSTRVDDDLEVYGLQLGGFFSFPSLQVSNIEDKERTEDDEMTDLQNDQH